MSNIKLIIFDAYGVCLSAGYPDTCKYLAKKFHRDVKTISKILYKKYFNLAALKKITQAKAWNLAVGELGLPITGRKAKEIHYSLMSTNKFILNTALKLKKNYKILLLSKNTRSQFRDMRRMFPAFRKVFGHDMINTWEYNLPKASRETMDFVFGRYKVKANECVYADDQKENLLAPKQLGVHTIFFRNNKQWFGELKDILSLSSRTPN